MRVIILRKQLSPEQEGEERERIERRREELREYLKKALKDYAHLITELQPMVKKAQEKLGILQKILNIIDTTFTHQNLASNPEELGEKAEEIIDRVGEIENWLDLSESDSLGDLLYNIFAGIIIPFKIAKPVLTRIAGNLTKDEREGIVGL